MRDSWILLSDGYHLLLTTVLLAIAAFLCGVAVRDSLKDRQAVFGLYLAAHESFRAGGAPERFLAAWRRLRRARCVNTLWLVVFVIMLILLFCTAAIGALYIWLYF